MEVKNLVYVLAELFSFWSLWGGESVSLSSVASTGCILLLEDPFQPDTDSFDLCFQ